ncbi:MAG: peptidoglycan-binding protein [Anaerolineae bacterium]|nr:peptidoglycan-binding protein [Anaerolineae bacterium]
MNRKNRRSLFIAVIVLPLTVLACISPTAPAMPTPSLPISTEVGQVGGVTATDTPPPALTDVSVPTEIPVTDTPVPTVCTFDAGYVADVTIPDDTPFLPNTAFIKTWRIQNTGSCDWEAGTKLVYFSGDQMGGPPSVDVPPTVIGANVDVAVNFTSPGTPGTYRSNWQAQRLDGTKFGQQFYVQIVVPEPTATPTNTPLPTALPTLTPLPTVKPVGAWPLVQYGAEGPEVYAIQYLLRAEGYSLTADGIFGPQTTSAVKSFQGTKGLTVDGIVGPNTWQALIQGNTVKKGSSGDAVWAAQHLLKHKHGYGITPDGSFGNQTDAAVRDLQKVYGLVVDGIVGQNTWKALVAG